MDLTSHRLGTVTLSPDEPVIAGSSGQWTLVYTAGSYGVDEGGTIKLSQRFASDWEIPQFDRPGDPAYTTVTTTGKAKIRAYYHTKAHARPWMKCLVMDIYDGSLAPGDTVTIILGDQSKGSPGIRAQTFQESAHEFRILVDPTNASLARRLPTSPVFPVIAGDSASLVCILPSQVVMDQSIDVFVKGEDRWGNPVTVSEPLSLEWIGQGKVAIDSRRLTPLAPGTGSLQVKMETDSAVLVCRSNPMTIYEVLPKLQRFWGDLHAQTAPTVGTGSDEEYFSFGRDVARLDFASHQGNDFQIDDAYWRSLNETTKRFHEDNRFVVFPGYEWSANTPAGGDRNVFYRTEGKPIFRSSHWQIPHVAEDGKTPAHPADVLFTRIREHVELDDVLMAAHVGGRYADVHRYFDGELGPLVEVLSCWGVFEWLLWDAFEHDYVVGIMCNSDGHKGRPGAEGPGAGEFGIRGGLTCVLAPVLTRDAVFSALKARRCYGTSGPRLQLSFDIDGHPMGSHIPFADALTVRASAVGAGPLESLTLYQGRTPIQTVRPAAFSAEGASRRIRVSWRGSRIRGRGRRVQWDGTIRLNRVHLQSATEYSFDSVNEGIIAQDSRELRFRSATTGDTDGVDLWLDDANAGLLTFTSAVGSVQVNLAEIATIGQYRSFDFGGQDMSLRIERYPEAIEQVSAELELEVRPPSAKRTPYFVKVVQEDGGMAWASPIYVEAK